MSELAVVEDNDETPVPFTEADRTMLREIHAAINAMTSAVESFVPMIANSPIGAMLGITV